MTPEEVDRLAEPFMRLGRGPLTKMAPRVGDEIMKTVERLRQNPWFRDIRAYLFNAFEVGKLLKNLGETPEDHLPAVIDFLNRGLQRVEKTTPPTGDIAALAELINKAEAVAEQESRESITRLASVFLR